MVCFGGGHNDYFGSDVHRFDIATRQWTRILDGYVTGLPEDYGAGAVYPSSTYPDGSPLPPHTYDYLQYDPVGNDMLLFKGQKELGPDVQAIAIPHLLNLDTLTWRHGPEHPVGIFNSGGWTTWDQGRRRLWGHSGDDGGGNGLSWFSPDGESKPGVVGKWGPLYCNKLPGQANHNAMQIDPRRNIILVAAHAMSDVYLMDPDDPESPLVPITQTGSRPPIAEYSALEYSDAFDCFVFFTSARSEEVFYLKSPTATSTNGLIAGTWIWSSLRSSLNPIMDAREASILCRHPEHVFGRFRVVDYKFATLAVLVRHIDSPVYAIRLR